MHILYITNSRLPTEKAHGLQIMKTIEAFINEGAQVTLLLPRRRNPIKNSIQEFYNLKQLPKIVTVPNYVGSLETRFHQAYFVCQRITFGISAFIYALFSGADIIYSRELTLSFFFLGFGKRLSMKITSQKIDCVFSTNCLCAKFHGR